MVIEELTPTAAARPTAVCWRRTPTSRLCARHDVCDPPLNIAPQVEGRHSGGVDEGETVIATTDVQRVGRRVSFANCYLHVGDRRVVHAGGCWPRSTRAPTRDDQPPGRAGAVDRSARPPPDGEPDRSQIGRRQQPRHRPTPDARDGSSGRRGENAGTIAPLAGTAPVTSAPLRRRPPPASDWRACLTTCRGAGASAGAAPCGRVGSSSSANRVDPAPRVDWIDDVVDLAVAPAVDARAALVGGGDGFVEPLALALRTAWLAAAPEPYSRPEAQPPNSEVGQPTVKSSP